MSVESAILIIVAIAIAWYLGYRARGDDLATKKIYLPRDYLRGLNYLLNEESDKAVDMFIKMLEVDSSTVETHLTLGKIFRRRGEVDRAIRIHQNLIARPQLEKSLHEQSLYELGQDYLSAGMLDRAERIFLEVINFKDYSIAAMRCLLDIYQQVKSWEKAIEIALQLAKSTGKKMHAVVAHYYCELACIALENADASLASRHVQQALSIDIQSVRASLLMANMEMTHGNYPSALQQLKKIHQQDSLYLSEAIVPLVICYEKLNEHEKLIDYLSQLLLNYPQAPIVLMLSAQIRKIKGDNAAAKFVVDHIQRYPSIDGLHLLVELYLALADEQQYEDWLVLHKLTLQLLADKPGYQCVSCGFSGKSLHWQCPGCKEWGSIKPIHSVEA